jgi:zinc-ribbon domain
MDTQPNRMTMIHCPKCSAEVRDIARFCRRCHATLRFECPACKHEQRHGGKCDQCGVDFLKYMTAMVSAKKVERDAERERLEGRTALLKNIAYIPLTLGIPLIRQWLANLRGSRSSGPSFSSRPPRR